MKMFKQVGFIAIAMLLFANDGFAAEKASKEKRNYILCLGVESEVLVSS